MLETVVRIAYKLERYWALSDRSIHYEVLNDPPLRQLSKPGSRYVNTKNCDKDLIDLLTRARLSEVIPFEAIEDPTRKIALWPGYDDVGSYEDDELGVFLQGFRRKRPAGQPYHLEIVGEKNTVESSIEAVARYYRIPYTLGRGYCSLDPRKKMLERFRPAASASWYCWSCPISTRTAPSSPPVSWSRCGMISASVRLKDLVPLKVCLNWDTCKSVICPRTSTSRPRR